MTSPPPPTETPAPLSYVESARRCFDALVAFFNTPEGFSAFGWHGDEHEWTPEQTAIEAMKECADLRARNEALTAELESAKRNSYSYTAARLVEAESTIARHVAALQEIGKGVEADQATIARLTAERDNALADADNDRSLAASRQREIARLSEELAQADEAKRDMLAGYAAISDMEGREGMTDASFAASALFTATQMVTHHAARHDTEGGE